MLLPIQIHPTETKRIFSLYYHDEHFEVITKENALVTVFIAQNAIVLTRPAPTFAIRANAYNVKTFVDRVERR